MITRREAEQQADDCFQYHAAAYGATLATLALLGSRSFATVAGIWGAGLLLHGVALYAHPRTREAILRSTAAGMEDRRAALEQRTAKPDTHRRPQPITA